ncbi:MAG: hypothetical protein Q8O76_10715 [Chloroflexota bacterium]|nr:hypothetical protein [Chloroflexota bacterium]
MYTLEVLNPVAPSKGELSTRRPARRLENLSGKRVGLLWNSKRGGNIALARAGELLQARFQDVKLIPYDGKLGMPQEVMDRAMKECDMAIGSTGD